MALPEERITKKIISIDIDLISYNVAIARIISFAKSKKPGYVCFVNVHMIIEAYEDKNFADLVNNATLLLADGMPIVKSLKILYGLEQERIAGMDVMPELIKQAEINNLKIFFFGSTPDVLEKMRIKTEQEFPKVNIVGLFSPPFNKSLDDDSYINIIRNSGADLVFIALGCPKQEKWVAKHFHKIDAVLLAVGGAFAIYAGITKRAPLFMQKNGLEWFYRLSQEPNRLFKRYFKTNALFIYLMVRLKMTKKLFSVLVFSCFINSINASSYIVDGYMNKISYNHGEIANVFINADTAYNGAKLYLYTVNHIIVDSLTVNLFPQNIINTNPWENGYGYSVSFDYEIPDNLKSGIYNWENKVFFIVKNTTKDADITIIYPSNTEAAYNNAGGKSLYDFNSTNSARAFVVSFLRPQTKANLEAVKVLSDGFIKWISTLDHYSVQVICDKDMDDYSEIQNSKIIVVIGHSEYWTRIGRLNFDQFVNSGKDAIILSGNTMWWQVRYNNDGNQLICYKNTLIDPSKDPLKKTIQWSASSLHYLVLSSIGLDWQHGALPTSTFHGWYGYKIMHPNSPLLIGTGLNFNDTLSCKSSEYDGSLFSGFNSQGDPVLDTTSLGFCKMELVGYDWGYNTPDPNSNKKGYGAFVAFKKYPSSGNIINTGFSGWCSGIALNGYSGGFGGVDSSKFKLITLNMFDLLLTRQNIYSTPVIIGCSSSFPGCDGAFSTEDQFAIFPNPSNGNFSVQSFEFGLQSLEIYNMLGEKIFYLTPFNYNFFVQIDLSFQPNSIYFLRINTECGTTLQKLLVQH
jgi:exopolysaccharide biosynthesis WecB/TagA/CpsF family protein